VSVDVSARILKFEINISKGHAETNMLKFTRRNPLINVKEGFYLEPR
jgi:hypothetical protein